MTAISGLSCALTYTLCSQRFLYNRGGCLTRHNVNNNLQIPNFLHVLCQLYFQCSVFYKPFVYIFNRLEKNHLINEIISLAKNIAIVC